MIRIVVLDKGFVSVGLTKISQGFVTIDHAAVVRHWGTTRGLGEIAENGPTDTTKLDKTPRQTVPMHSVVKMIDCEQGKWTEVLGIKAEAKRK